MTEQTPTSTQIGRMAHAIQANPMNYELTKITPPECWHMALDGPKQYRRCGNPARFKTPNGELLCPTHAAVRAIDKGMEA